MDLPEVSKTLKSTGASPWLADALQLHTHTHTHTHVCQTARTCTYTLAQTCIGRYIYMYIYMSIHMYMYTSVALALRFVRATTPAYAHTRALFACASKRETSGYVRASVAPSSTTEAHTGWRIHSSSGGANRRSAGRASCAQATF